MFFRGLHGHQKYEYVGHRLAVRGFERNRRFKAHVANEYPVKVLNASMRNSDPLTQAGRSDLFPEGETARHRLLRQGVRPLHVAADFVNKLAFAGNIHVQEDVSGREESSDIFQCGLLLPSQPGTASGGADREGGE